VLGVAGIVNHQPIELAGLKGQLVRIVFMVFLGVCFARLPAAKADGADNRAAAAMPAAKRDILRMVHSS